MRFLEIVHRLLGLEHAELLERQRVLPRLAVADAREVEPERGEPRRRHHTRHPHVQSAGTDPMQEPGVQEDHRGRLGVSLRRVGLGEDAEHVPALPKRTTRSLMLPSFYPS